MQRPAVWKILTLGAAFTGLGLFGAGSALAEGAPMAVPVHSVSTDGPFDDLDDLVRLPDVPRHLIAFDDDDRGDDWFWGDDDWGDH